MRKSFLMIAVMLMLASGAMATTIVGTVVDSNGEAVEGAYVTVTACDSTGQGGQRGHRGGRNGEPGVPPEGVFVTETAEDGTFEIIDVTGGTYNIHAMIRGLGGIRQEIIVPEEGILEVDLQLVGEGGDHDGDDRGERRRDRRQQRPHRVD